MTSILEGQLAALRRGAGAWRSPWKGAVLDPVWSFSGLPSMRPREAPGVRSGSGVMGVPPWAQEGLRRPAEAPEDSEEGSGGGSSPLAEEPPPTRPAADEETRKRELVWNRTAFVGKPMEKRRREQKRKFQPERRMTVDEMLLRSIAGNQLGAMQEALRLGADPSAQVGGERIIHLMVRLACKTGDLRGLSRLLKSPVGKRALKSKNAYGETPLHEAAALGNVKVVRLLLRHGADPLARDRIGRTPQMLAHSQGKSQAAETLGRYILEAMGGRAADREEAMEHMSTPSQKRLQDLLGLDARGMPLGAGGSGAERRASPPPRGPEGKGVGD